MILHKTGRPQLTNETVGQHVRDDVLLHSEISATLPSWALTTKPNMVAAVVHHNHEKDLF